MRDFLTFGKNQTLHPNMKVYIKNGRIVERAPEDILRVKGAFDDNGPQAKSITIIIIKRILHIIVPSTMLSTASALSHRVLIKSSAVATSTPTLRVRTLHLRV